MSVRSPGATTTTTTEPAGHHDRDECERSDTLRAQRAEVGARAQRGARRQAQAALHKDTALVGR